MFRASIVQPSDDLAIQTEVHMGSWRRRLSLFALGRFKSVLFVCPRQRRTGPWGSALHWWEPRGTVAGTARAGEEEDADSEPSLTVISSLD